MRWEYKSVKLRAGGFLGVKIDQAALEGMLNELGRQGWELAVVFDTNTVHGITRDIVVIFKRAQG